MQGGGEKNTLGADLGLSPAQQTHPTQPSPIEGEGQGIYRAFGPRSKYLKKALSGDSTIVVSPWPSEAS